MSLFDRRLMLEWAFHNTGAAPLPLHFGIHPYFCVGPKDAVRVSGAEGLAVDNKLGVERDVRAVDFAAGEVDLHFACELGGATLTRGDGRSVKLSWTEQFGTLVLWTLPGQPFVCVEPWYGIASPTGEPGELSEKEGILTLEPGQSFTATYSMEIG